MLGTVRSHHRRRLPAAACGSIRSASQSRGGIHEKIRTYAVVAALSLLPLAGCGDDDSDDNYKAKPSKA
ncbi:hypothetical protein KBZ21_43900, partial [Streptomyces sp. A73]|nr:hypothetical protein [Streptomyces sp. A73]